MKEQNKIPPISKTVDYSASLGKHMSAAFEKWKEDNKDCFNPTVDPKYLYNRLWLAFMRGGDSMEQFKSSLQPTIEEVKQDQIMYLNEGRLYKTSSDEPGELSITIISTMYLSALSELVAELHSLKMSINESPLKDFFPVKEMSFHDKCLFAIHAISESKRIKELEEALRRTKGMMERLKVGGTQCHIPERHTSSKAVPMK